jgi:hypothetical protein
MRLSESLKQSRSQETRNRSPWVARCPALDQETRGSEAKHENPIEQDEIDQPMSWKFGSGLHSGAGTEENTNHQDRLSGRLNREIENSGLEWRTGLKKNQSTHSREKPNSRSLIHGMHYQGTHQRGKDKTGPRLASGRIEHGAKRLKNEYFV